MAVSKVVLGDETLVDLTSDTVSSENLLQGETAHGANGEEVIGGVVVTPMYTGTKAAIEEAIALGQIPEDAVVNITDDEETSSFQTQINEINSSLQKVDVYVGDDKKLHFVDSAGADSVLPFNSLLDGIDYKEMLVQITNANTVTYGMYVKNGGSVTPEYWSGNSFSHDNFSVSRGVITAKNDFDYVIINAVNTPNSSSGGTLQTGNKYTVPTPTKNTCFIFIVL